MMLRAEELQEDLIASSRIFHFGSLSMTHPLGQEATRRALKIAKKHDCLISFDPNLREPLWDSLDNAREQIVYGMSQCDVLKISDNELQWFTGMNGFDEGVSFIQSLFGIPLILLSKGPDGSSAYYKGFPRVDAAPFLQENTIETTGAGDTFCACILNSLLDRDLNDLQPDDLKDMLRFANAAASLITTRRGALRVMPTREEVERLITF